MFSFNGTGTRLLGCRDKDDQGWYTATEFFCVLYLPIIPLACYRVRKLGVIEHDPRLPLWHRRYESYPIEATIPQARNVYLLAYGLPALLFLAYQIWLA